MVLGKNIKQILKEQMTGMLQFFQMVSTPLLYTIILMENLFQLMEDRGTLMAIY